MRSQPQQEHLRRLLEELESGIPLSQRALSARLGIALGRINQLLRSLVADGRLDVRRGPGQLRHYVVTPVGAETRARLTREFLGRAVATLAPARDRIQAALRAIPPVSGDGRAGPRPAVVLHAPDSITHIGYACAVEAGVELVGFVGDGPQTSLLGLPMRDWTSLTSEAFDGRRVDWLLIVAVSSANEDAIRQRLAETGFPCARVSWL